jgi:uncharacterized membrane protein YgdD (TMEM256/DUF423 family)
MTAGALLMVVAVALGAFGAHGQRSMVTSQQLASYQTGVTYHLFHALGLVLVGIVGQVSRPTPWLTRAAVLMLAGIAFFSGSIYAMTFGAPRWLGMVAPVGGSAFMLAWVAVALHARAAR